MTTPHHTLTGETAPEAAPIVVGLGASAGGIDALRDFFASLRPDGHAAYVVILHLSPDHDSQLAAVLQATARMPVTQVHDRVTIERDHVYVVPPNKLLSIEGRAIVVTDMLRAEDRRSPVDLFFRSLADAHGAAAVGVVLSGTGQNGSAGIKRIKEYGGFTVAQDPNEAEYSDMPRNAIATGHVDMVLRVATMPEKIAAWCERVRIPALENASSTPASEMDSLRDVLTALRVRTGHDFSNYKTGTIGRRIARRMHVCGAGSIGAYAGMLRENPEEPVALLRELLISVTNFFRDDAAFDALAEKVIPRMFVNKRGEDQIRVWVPACATGEEAYSIAMLLAEHATVALDQPTIQIFATDLDGRAVATARDAFYTDAEVSDVREERLQRFFVRESRGYRVRREIRELVLFAQHNVTKDPPFSHLDLISCRNLLIYLNRAVQERVMEMFHFALRPGGFVFLGGSESPDGAGDLFTAADKNAHIYESRLVTSARPMPLRDHPLGVARSPMRPVEPRLQERISASELHQELLERYAPPSLVANEEHTVVHMSDRVGRYLQVAGGEPTRELLKLVRPDLRADLRSALYQAQRERTIVEVKGVVALLDDGERRVDITVKPVLRDGEPAKGYLLVTFDEDVHGVPVPDEARQRPAADPASVQLEEELSRVKQQLRNTVEQYETQVEEANAANQELQAMNEELRSAAEELETSKEELQSVNEELTTVNQELKVKLEELGLTNNDFQNLINANDAATIFLDRHLRVKLSTPAAGRVFNLLRTDVGRPLSDITSHVRYPSLYDDLRQVLADLRTIDREVELDDGGWAVARVRPYRTMDDRIDGVVITFQEITERKRAEDRARAGEERLRLLIDGAIEYAIFTMSVAGIIDSWNSGAERMFRYTADEIIGQPFDILFIPDDRDTGAPATELEQATINGRAGDERLHRRKDGSTFYCSGSTIRLGRAMGFAKIARDLSVHRDAAAALATARAEVAERVIEQTHQLKAEVTARATAHEQAMELLKRIVTAQEEERARIARDLHDQLGQQLTALRLSLERHRESLDQQTNQSEDLLRALALTDGLNRDLDYLSWELRPAVLDDLGLAAALPLFVREWSEHHRIAAEYRSTASGGELGRDAEVVFYRVAQEALNNVVKHAHASRVDVLLDVRSGTVTLLVEDDGIGFDPADTPSQSKGIGIVGMKERAALAGASLQIESEVGAGTSIYLRCAAIDPGAPHDTE
jgi:two-component system CheB/CheR fusion protein